jgi:hydroxymethylpyrimidine/phosphomethylpyrimidine kinase
VLVLAGLDPSGKAGLLADFDAVRNAGARAFGIATALTAQGRNVFAVQPVSPRLIREQLLALRESARIDAVKIGMVPNEHALATIAEGLRDIHLTWVVDPVTRTSLGQRLSRLSRSSWWRGDLVA